MCLIGAMKMHSRHEETLDGRLRHQVRVRHVFANTKVVACRGQGHTSHRGNWKVSCIKLILISLIQRLYVIRLQWYSLQLYLARERQWSRDAALLSKGSTRAPFSSPSLHVHAAYLSQWPTGSCVFPSNALSLPDTTRAPIGTDRWRFDRWRHHCHRYYREWFYRSRIRQAYTD